MSSEYTLRDFEYTSGPALLHTIVHGLNTLAPCVVVYNTASQLQLIPEQVFVVDSNTVQITTTTLITIYGRIF